MSTDSTPDNATTLIVEGYHCSACIDQRALIRFDLTGFDKQAAITRAELMLFSPRQPRVGPGNLRTFIISKAWTSANANWFNATQTVRWSKAGGDFNAAIKASLKYAPEVVNVWHTLDVTEVIKGFVKNPETNFGLLLMLEPAMYTVAYVSSEGAQIDQRPKLVIAYSTTAVTNNRAPGTAVRQAGIHRRGTDLQLIVPDNGTYLVRMERLDGSTVFTRLQSGPEFFIDTRNLSAGYYGIITQGHHGTLRNFVNLAR